MKTIVMEESTFLKRHAKEILIGTGIVIGVGAIALITKHNIDISKMKIENLRLKDHNDTLMSAASEGLFEEAITTVTRKINYKKDRLEFLNNALAERPGERNTQVALMQLSKELTALQNRLESFKTSQMLYEISLE